MSRFLPDFLPTFLPGLRTAGPRTVVALNAHGAAWLAQGATGVAGWRHVSWPGQTPRQALALLRPQLPLPGKGGASRGITWVWAPSLVRHWLQSPPAQVASLSELRSVAQARCGQLFGMPSQEGDAAWAVSANWQASQPFVCSAMPSEWAQALAPVCTGPHSGQDLLARVLQRRAKDLPRDGWLALVLAHTLYLLRLERHQVMSLRFMRLTADASHANIQTIATQEWTREMLRTEQAATRLHWLCLLPGGATAQAAGPLQTVPFLPSAIVPLPSLGLDDRAVPGVHAEPLSELLLTAWCAEQSLAPVAKGAL